MNILKFYAYLFYRLKNYYELWQAVFVFNVILLIHIMSIVAIYASIMHLGIRDVWFFYSTKDYFYDRLVLGTIRIAPIFFVTYLLSRLFKKRLEAYYIEFYNEPIEKQKRRHRGMIIYFVFTVLFLIFSIVSSSFL